MATDLTSDILALAKRRGAAEVGVCAAAPFARERDRLVTARSEGRSGPLHFTFDHPDLGTNPRQSFPWAQRLVVVGTGYLDQSPPSEEGGGFVARFATADHYVRLRGVTEAIASRLTEAGYRAEVVIDDNRLVDRAAAVRAGVGWQGWSTMVLAPGVGPWMLLGSVVTDAPLTETAPMVRDCGTCRACLPACPTGALSEAHGLDARRCLATWLQAPGSLPHWIRPHLGTRIYGCDDCLTSCPPGFRALTGPSPKPATWDLTTMLAKSDQRLLAEADWWYVPRREGRFIRRNLLVAAGNSGNPDLAPVIEAHLNHPSSMIRGHAASALAKLLGVEARPALRRALDAETVAEARDELIIALVSLEHPDAYTTLLEADEWASTDTRILGLALMGSHASAGGTNDSDLDLLVLTPHPGQVEPPPVLGDRHLGLPVALGRALGHQIRGAVPIDFVVAPLDWPTDDGGERALAAGIVPLHDPEQRIADLRRSR